MKQTRMLWACTLACCVVAVLLYSGPAAAQAPPPPPPPPSQETPAPTPTQQAPPPSLPPATAVPIQPTATAMPSASMDSATESENVDLVCFPNHAGRPLAICPSGNIYLFGAPSYELIQIADGILIVTSYADGKPYVFILRGDEVEIVQW